MEIFKLFESTIAEIQPGHVGTKDLRRDQLLDNYDEATKTLEALIKAKENELAYRRDLIDMLEKSKAIYDKKQTRAKLAYQTAKKYAPESLDLRGPSKRSSSNTSSPTSAQPQKSLPVTDPIVPAESSLQSSQKSSELDIPLPSENLENRSSLDRRLSEFLKTFPNLTQAGSAPPSNNNNIKPLPGYYTQQPPPPPPTSIAAAPPIMAMMRFPPPPLIPSNAHQSINPASQENHDTADMDLSDYDDSSNTAGATVAGGLIPMVASAMQQGAGGKQHLRADSQQTPYLGNQQFSNTVQYPHRINPLPFDPSIMEPRLRDSSSSSRDKHSQSERGSHRHSSSSSSSGAGAKHGSDRNKYASSSSHSSNRSKRR